MERFIGIGLIVVILVVGLAAYKYGDKIFNKNLFSFSGLGYGNNVRTINPPGYSGSGYSQPISQPKPEPKISINYASPMGLYGRYSQIGLSVTAPGGEKIDITGWQIKNNKDSRPIPRGTDIYGSDFVDGDIYVKDGDTVNIYSHSNTAGANFRLNKCIGYVQGLDPENPRNCPYVDRSKISSFSGACQNYIYSLSSCVAPDHNPPVPLNDYACRDFLSKLNYDSCVAQHRDDSDFFGKEWRIWLTRYGNTPTDILDPYHDHIQLIDKNGMIRAEYSY